MSTKHTPGPWHVGEKTGMAVFSDEQLLADCTCAYGMAYTEAKANARLIAAAPDLLSALNAIINHPAHEDPLSGRKVIAARAAIARATGAQS